MLKLEDIKKRIEDDRKQDAQRAEDVRKTKEQITAMDEQINKAILSGKSSTAEDLLSKQGALKTRLSILERVVACKTAPDAYYDDLLELCTKYAADKQPVIDAASAAVRKAHQEYLEKRIALAGLIKDAISYRVECGSLAGLGILYGNERYHAFPEVQYEPQLIYDLSTFDRNEVLKKDPEYLETLSIINNLSLG